ncbi:MAG: hypothetical protein GX615_13095, partial [Lentisphaerae bacterium]|nr:hypothetical protein [Lentisphaerota bacterium]
LREYWNSVRADVAALVNSGAPLPLLGWGAQRRLDEVLRRTIPELAARSRKDVQKGG